jgi:hypothetical protein
MGIKGGKNLSPRNIKKACHSLSTALLLQGVAKIGAQSTVPCRVAILKLPTKTFVAFEWIHTDYVVMLFFL